MQFLVERRRSGHLGTFIMGLEHGAFCLGCCWFLMAVLFVGGIMNLYWIAGLAIVVALEKLAPMGGETCSNSRSLSHFRWPLDFLASGNVGCLKVA